MTAPPKTADLFIGTWILLDQTTTNNGEVIANAGLSANVSGTLIFEQGGYCSAILTAAAPATPRPTQLSVLDYDDSSRDAEWALVGKQCLAYSGPWAVDEEREELVNGPVMVANVPAFVGTLQRRKFTFSDDGKHMRLEASLGDGHYTKLNWEKAAPR